MRTIRKLFKLVPSWRAHTQPGAPLQDPRTPRGPSSGPPRDLRSEIPEPKSDTQIYIPYILYVNNIKRRTRHEFMRSFSNLIMPGHKFHKYTRTRPYTNNCTHSIYEAVKIVSRSVSVFVFFFLHYFFCLARPTNHNSFYLKTHKHVHKKWCKEQKIRPR